MANGYEEIDNLMQEQNTLLEQQKAEQNKIIDTGLQKTQNEINRQKEEYDREATKQGKALYTDYRKQSNPYGATAEQLASQGLNKSGYAETTQTNLYNTYQKNVTSLMTETTRLKAEADFQMNQAFLDADIQKAQNALAIYQQQAQLAVTNYNLRYQKYRDDVADMQWEKSYQLQKQQAQQSQTNWEREYQLSLEKSKKAKGTDPDEIIDYENNGGGTVPKLSDNAKAILEGFTNNNIKNTNDESLKEKARNKIGYDYLAGRISEEEGDYLNNYFGLN